MVKKYRIGTPVNTEAVTESFEIERIDSFPLSLEINENVIISFPLENDDMIFGLGENVRGIQ